jgi:hypothetical protein
MKTVLSHANLIDCVEPKVRPDSAVLIEDGRIRAIASRAEPGVRIHFPPAESRANHRFLSRTPTVEEVVAREPDLDYRLVVQQEIRWPTGGIAAADLRQVPFLAAKVIFRCPSRLEAATDWLAVREADLLPVGYFHVVFTLPAPRGTV